MSYYAEKAQAELERLTADENDEILQYEAHTRRDLTKRVNRLEFQVTQLVDRVNLLLSIHDVEAKMKSGIERISNE